MRFFVDCLQRVAVDCLILVDDGLPYRLKRCLLCQRAKDKLISRGAEDAENRSEKFARQRF